MDKWLRDELALQEIDDLTAIQSKALDAGLTRGQSMIVSAPTSSGKTLVGEIAILAGLRRGNFALYLVSHKALADQKYEDFSRKYRESRVNPLRVGVATGDRDDGDPDPQIVIATYERALSLVISGATEVGNAVIVADELQILGEENRGPEIELLCTLLRSRQPAQFVALTATIENTNDLAGWLTCVEVTSTQRDVDLIQEIWTESAVHTLKYGDELKDVRSTRANHSLNTLDAVDALLKSGRGPVLVFVETRRDAMDLASQFAERRMAGPGLSLLQKQLDLFSEATEFSDRLKSSASARVAFHTADLTPAERGLVEQGLLSNEFDTCFATPTLAAGVNFPFQTVLFDRIRRRYIPPPLLPLGNYRNMSGRAGRLRMHEKGYAILLPRDEEERRYTNALVGPENERMISRLPMMSMRKIALALVSWDVAVSQPQLVEFLQGTLFWYQVQNVNASRLGDIVAKLRDAIEWLIEKEMVADHDGVFRATELGRAVARSGLLPSSAVQIVDQLKKHREALESNFESSELALFHMCCNLDEFDAEIGQRFLPPVNPGTDSSDVMSMLRSTELYVSASRRGANNAAVAIDLFASGEQERRISARTGVPSGQVHRFAGDVAWILEGIQKIASVPTVGTQPIMNELGILARRVRLGVPLAVYDLLRIAQKAQVPGFGRQRAVAMIKNRYADRESAIRAGVDKLERVVGHRDRAEKLIEALSTAAPDTQERVKAAHLRKAILHKIEDAVRMSYESEGSSYTEAVLRLLSLVGNPELRKVSDNEFEMTSVSGGAPSAILVRCLVATPATPSISAQEAFFVERSPNRGNATHFVTVARPSFDIMAEKKACTSADVTLVPHASLVAAVLQTFTHPEVFTSVEFFTWLTMPGTAELEILLTESGAPASA